MPLIISGGSPPKKTPKGKTPGHKSSALIANQARAELDALVAAVLADLDTIAPDWETADDAATVFAALQDLQDRWAAKINATAQSLAARWTSAVDDKDKEETAEALRKALGVDQARILDGPATRGIVQALGREASATIKTIPSELISSVTEAVAKSYRQEPLPEGRTLAQEIAHISGHAYKRAKFIAKDQTQKLHGGIVQARQAELGIKEFVWRTMRDARVVGNPAGLYPNPTALHGNHYERNGVKYRWDNLPPDGGPGWPIGCRCYAEPVIDMDTIDLVEVSTPTMSAVPEAKPAGTRTRPTPEPWAGYRAQHDALAARLLAAERKQSDAREQLRGEAVDRQEYEALLAAARKEAAAIRGQITKLKGTAAKQQAATAPIGIATTPPPPEKTASKK